MVSPKRNPLICLALLSAALLSACASVPIFEPPPRDSGVTIQPIRMRGPRGSLSRRETARILKTLNAQAPDADAFDRHLEIEQFVAGSPLYTGNKVTILRDGPQTFGAMFAAMHSAQHYLYLEYYILQDVSYAGERLSDLLVARAQAGLRIDVIYDSLGSLSTPADFFQRLQAAGIHLHKFHPISALFLLNRRDHRKILIADSRAAIVGGINLSTDYENNSFGSGSGGSSDDDSDASSAHTAPTPPATPSGAPAPPAAAATAAAIEPGPPAPPHEGAPLPWHDTDLQIQGPAVMALKALFEAHWRHEKGAADELATYPDPPGPQGDQIVRIIGSLGGQTLPHYYATLLSAIRTATSRIWIEAAYFVPTLQERQALARAARRGVDVRLLLPSHSDSAAVLAVQHAYYGGLLRAGVKIYERDDGILHSKTAVMDGVWSIVGSSNFDHRSVLFNDEVDAVVIGDKTGGQLEQDFQQDLQHAHAIGLANWRNRPFSHKLREDFWRIWQHLL